MQIHTYSPRIVYISSNSRHSLFEPPEGAEGRLIPVPIQVKVGNGLPHFLW